MVVLIQLVLIINFMVIAIVTAFHLNNNNRFGLSERTTLNVICI